jgi:hypothetical protein
VSSRLLKTTVLAATVGAGWIRMPRVLLRVKLKRGLSLKCWLLAHDDWMRRGPGRLCLECFECGRETHGWTTGRHDRADRAGSRAVQAVAMRTGEADWPAALVDSPARHSRRSQRSIADDRDMTRAA